MIIRSSFRDYYDRVTGRSGDASVVYQRETTHMPFESPFVANDLPIHFPTGDSAFDERAENAYTSVVDAPPTEAQPCMFHVRTFGVPTFVASIDPELTRYEQRNINLYAPKIALNPRLADYNFVTYLDAFSAFSRIEDFISGVLGQPSPAMIEVSNDVKITKAGFDDKTSFKKR